MTKALDDARYKDLRKMGVPPKQARIIIKEDNRLFKKWLEKNDKK